MSLAALPSHSTHSVSSKPPPVFEFTKRKKWADILISELSGSLLLVLNPSAHILWASPAIVEQLGWRDEELLERPIRDILHDDDAAPFADHLKRAVDDHSELFSYARLRSKFASPRSGSHPASPIHSPTTPTHSGPPLGAPAPASTNTPLFELRGHAIYSKGSAQSSSAATGDAGPSTSASSSSAMNLDSTPNPNAEAEVSCFIVMARPYPSRNTAMLDSFLELKIENERLRQQLLNLRTSGVPPSPVLASPAYPINQITSASETPLMQPASALSSPVYPTANLAGPASGDADAAFQPRSIHAMPQPPAATNLYYPPQANRFGGQSFDQVYNSTSFGAGPSTSVGAATASARRGSIAEEPVTESTEAGRTRKKPKKAHAAQEQYVCVTCGRTDSPEWRKRKTDEFGGAEGGGAG
ncbi:White collar 2 protein [Ceratobasidium sp. AG-Ba]|nr:White collar 2 protein [Ceratobasidium sp. AG-Ba]